MLTYPPIAPQMCQEQEQVEFCGLRLVGLPQIALGLALLSPVRLVLVPRTP